MKASSKSIIHVIAQLRMGAGRVVADTAIEQANTLQHQVAICVSTDADEYWKTSSSLVAELASHNVGVHTIGDFFHRKANLLHQSAGTLKEIIKGLPKPVVVHAHTAMAAAVGSWANPDALIATCHGWGIGRPAEFDLQDSIAYQLCDTVLTYSDYWADRLKTDLAVDDSLMIPMGLNLRRIETQTRRSISQGPLRIGVACELTPRKGVDLLLSAMPAVWNEIPDTELHIIGHGDSSASLRELAGKIDPGLKRIQFYGALLNPSQKIGDWDLFVLASRSDNLPVVLLEAMYAGLPIVATEVGGVPKLIETGKCGMVVPPESVSALSDGILQFARKQRKELIRIGLNGKKFVQRENDVKRTVQSLDKIYQNSLRRRRSPRRNFC
jgi:glycosyltransferase involved in cell wall biosynthesis